MCNTALLDWNECDYDGVEKYNVPMDRTLRCELLARLADSGLDDLAALLPADAVQDRIVVSGPTVGMVMARVVEGARGEVFNAGEVLVTECQVRIDREEGWGMVLGSRSTAALNIATIDAAIVAERVSASVIDDLLSRRVEVLDDELVASQVELAATRVQFETQ